MTTFNALIKKPFQNMMGKGETVGNQHFLLFQQCLLSDQRQIKILK